MNRHRNKGFTLVEVTLGIAFLAILLIAILVLTLTAGKLYIKGNTNQTINQSGRDFSDTVRRDFLVTGMSLVTPTIKISGGDATTFSGRICVGTVTYLWNSAALINNNSAFAKSAQVTMGTSNKIIKAVRIVNPKQSYCDKDGAGRYPMNVASNEQAVDLFGGTDRDYALYDMTMRPIAMSGERGLYEIAFTLGTNQIDTTQKNSSGEFIQCKPNDSLTADFNYCSVNDFNMIVRVGGIM